MRGAQEALGMAVDKSMNVLVVDDYKTMIRIVRGLLQQLGFHNIDDATDGPSALDKFSTGTTASSSRTGT